METPVPDSDLVSSLNWAKECGFSDDPEVAFSTAAWGKLGDCLWDALWAGDTLGSPLVVHWGVANWSMREGEEEDEEGSEILEKLWSSGTSCTVIPCPEPPWVNHLSPKDY